MRPFLRLRSGALRELRHAEDPASYASFTALKLWAAAAAVLPLAGLGEGAACPLSPLLFCSALLVAGAQLSFTVLANWTDANSVAVVATAKVAPQWLLAAVIARLRGCAVVLAPTGAAGVAVLGVAVALWTGERAGRPPPPHHYGAAHGIV